MKTKLSIAVACILLAISATVVLARKQNKQLPATGPATNIADSTGGQAKVVAYYFHGNVRCATCKKIEGLSHDVLISEFQPQLASGRLTWQTVNVEAPENEHFFKDYQLITWSLVLVTYENGRQRDYKVLNDTWKLASDEGAFRRYVKGEVQTALGRI